MSSIHTFDPGDFLIFQLESGYALLRVLDVEDQGTDPVWHVAVYNDLFLDPDMADSAIEDSESLSIAIPHVALTNRAFESTQVAKMGNASLTEADLVGYEAWKTSGDRHVSDRSVRLLLGLR
jgi:hypothetical protein